MKIERTKNATRNMVFGGMSKIYQIIIPFVMRTLIIYLLGPGYAGLNGLFTSILQVLNLAELGVGSAMIFSMYKPIAEDDHETICALMALYRFYYRVIGLVIAVAGIALLPFIPKLIKTDLPNGVNIYVLYLMNLMATVLTYWLFAYRNSILTAHQRSDIASRVALITDTIKYLIQVTVLVIYKDYYLYVLAILFTQVLANIWVAVMSKRLFPQYNPAGKLDKKQIKSINKRIADLFTSKIGAVVVGSADAIVISAFLGLTDLTIYQNYFYPINSIISIVSVVYYGCTAGIGNSLITETKEKNFKDLQKFTFLILWIATFCTSCFLTLLQPFMELWMGKELMVQYPIVICFAIYFFVYEINALLNLYKDAAGMWHEDRFRPLVTALSNLVLNVIMVQFWGLYGIILSTVISMGCVGMPWILSNLFTVVFDRGFFKKYLKSLGIYVVNSLIICALSCVVALQINGNLLFELVMRFIVCCVIVNVLYVFMFRKKLEYKESVALIDKITNGKLKVLKIS